MISDLDDLVLACRSSVAKRQIQEAVDCYRAGAYRSAIIATWIAVLFDYISKLRELEISGDKKAKSRLEALQKARESGDVSASLAFEKGLINESRDEYELVSEIESTDLQRLFEDRNRCAHSTMLSSDEPYSPSAELARSHIKNAVTAFLQHPPVQGKAALERVFQDIKSEYFPIDFEKAYKFLKSGPLARARKPLVRSLTIGITKDLLQEFKPQQERGRQFAALKAIERLYPTEFESALVEVLPSLMQAIKDDDFHLAIRYVRQIEPAWSAMGQSAQIRSVTSVESAIPDSLLKFIGAALQTDQLKHQAAKRLPDLSLEQICPFSKSAPNDAFIHQLLIQRGIHFLKTVKSFRAAERVLEEILLPMAGTLRPEDLSQIVEACEQNDQVQYAFQTTPLLVKIIENSELEDPTSKASWKRLYSLATSNHFQGEPNSKLAELLQNRFGFESSSGTDADDIPF